MAWGLLELYEANFDKQVGNDSRNKAVYFFIDRVRNYLTDEERPITREQFYNDNIITDDGRLNI